MRYFIATYKQNNQNYNNIYCNNLIGWDEYHSDTFTSSTEDLQLLILSVKGKTYQERKAYTEELAKDWQYNYNDFSWSYGELAIVCDFFEKMGKRYGLLKEFKENAIC